MENNKEYKIFLLLLIGVELPTLIIGWGMSKIVEVLTTDAQIFGISFAIVVIMTIMATIFTLLFLKIMK